MANRHQNMFANNPTGGAELQKLWQQSIRPPRVVADGHRNDPLTKNGAGTIRFEFPMWLLSAWLIAALLVSFQAVTAPAPTDESDSKIHITLVKWRLEKQRLVVKGDGAPPSATVAIRDENGNPLGETQVRIDGTWRLRQLLDRSPCQIEVVVGEESITTPVENAPFYCTDDHSTVQIQKAKWKPKTSKLVVKGDGAPTSATVAIRDENGNLLGETQVRIDGTWAFRQLLDRSPCQIEVVVGEESITTPVENAPFYCTDDHSTVQIQKAKWKPETAKLVIKGYHASPLAIVLIIDVEADTVIATLEADRLGFFVYRGTFLVPPCEVSAGVNEIFSDPIPVNGATAVCGGSGDDAEDPGNDENPDDPGDSETDITDQIAAFSQTVFPLLRAHCVGCHAGFGPGSPNIAHSDAGTAYFAVVDNQKVDLDTPFSSRLVQRLAADGHYCWGDCDENAEEMRAAIAQWVDTVGDNDGDGDVDGTLTSGTLSLADGIEQASNVRNDDDVIALYEFKEGSGEIANDSSGIPPAMDLTLVGAEWLAGGGIQIKTGKATAIPDTSRKLYDLIASSENGSDEYSIEAWVTPGNIDQEGPARIVSYSEGTGTRNFTMGQVNYSYVLRNRSEATGINQNGMPNLMTNDDDQDLRATLQHVVMTFDQAMGRRIYIDGVFTDDEDPQGPGSLSNWNPNYTFLLGNETTDNRLWLGRIHFVAVHKRALTSSEVTQNFEAGVGKRVLLRFDISQWTGSPESYIEFEVREFDNYSYLFSKPTFFGPTPNGMRIKDIRIAVNGQAPVAGQAFINVDMMITEAGQKLSPLASLIAKDKGPKLDVFSVLFEILGDYESTFDEPIPPAPPTDDLDESLPDTGIRNFDQINNTMATLTGVDPNVRAVRETFAEIKQQLPSNYDVRTFVSTHQMAIFKLALEYCDHIVESSQLREQFFGNEVTFDFNAPAVIAFSDPNQTKLLTDRLVDGMVGINLASQPHRDEARPILSTLIDTLIADCDIDNCGQDRTRTVVKSACAAVLGSAPVLLH